MKKTPDKTTSYRILGKHYAQHFITGSKEDKIAVAKACEEQGILSAIVYRHLLLTSATAAADFLLTMINRTTSANHQEAEGQ